MLLNNEVIIKGSEFRNSENRTLFYKTNDHINNFKDKYTKLFGNDDLDIFDRLSKYLTKNPDYEVWTALRFIKENKEVSIIDFKYSISSKGRLWSHVSNKELKFYLNNVTGYYSRPIDGVQSSWHRAVIASFCPIVSRVDGIPTHRLHVNHKDHIRSNNELLNLEWTTREENMEDMREVMDKDHTFYPKPVKITLAFNIGTLLKGSTFYIKNRKALSKFNVPEASIRNAISKGIYMFQCYFETIPVEGSELLDYNLPDELKEHFMSRKRVRSKKLIQK